MSLSVESGRLLLYAAGWNRHRGFLPNPRSLWIAHAADSIWRKPNPTAAKSASVGRPSQSQSQSWEKELRPDNFRSGLRTLRQKS